MTAPGGPLASLFRSIIVTSCALPSCCAAIEELLRRSSRTAIAVSTGHYWPGAWSPKHQRQCLVLRYYLELSGVETGPPSASPQVQ
ncbi:MAG: hypothetical protein M3137_10670 [Actinomycetota bacterium]|nr:hypothetical protein [Actinomycetota bacterium]